MCTTHSPDHMLFAGAGFTDVVALAALTERKIERFGLTLAQECILEKGLVEWKGQQATPTAAPAASAQVCSTPVVERAAAYIDNLDVDDM